MDTPRNETRMQLADTLPRNWKYVSEGGATIVFSYIGPSNPRFDDTVLRLRKRKGPSPTIASDFRELDLGPQQIDEPDDPMIEYQKECMERLIPHEHLPRLESVRLERPWLEALVGVHNVNRPDERRNKDRIDTTRTKGVLATDLVGGDWLAVEIKPKWAFLPSPAHLSEATRLVKTRTCRFCMHSYMRSKRGESVSLGYCPLDLFSGDRERIATAIRSLWNAWSESNGTVNNLKIFVKGKTILPADSSLILADDARSVETASDLREVFVKSLLPLLTDTPVLRTLSKLQRTLDALDIEGLSKLWRLTETSNPLYRAAFASSSEQAHENLVSNLHPNTPRSSPIGISSPYLSSPEPTLTEWNEFLDTYISSNNTTFNHSNPFPENLRYYLLAYLLSATFKDCSIILRLDRLRPGVSTMEAVKPDRVTVIDLDPKSLDRLRKWEILDQEIADAYSEVEPKGCVDAWVE